MAKYIITGGCGFIGSRLAKKLIEENHQVIIIDDLSNGSQTLPEATLKKHNITEIDSISVLFQQCDGCFHLAAIPTVELEFNEWLNLHKINLTGSLNVFKCAIDAGNIPTVYASSCSVYGNSKSLPLHEDQYIQPVSSYACDKYSTELNAHFLAYNYQLPVCGLRFFNVYGPGQNPNSPYSGVITHFITNILNNKPIDIYGNGEQTRDFVFVDDVVNALIHAMYHIKKMPEVVNICSNNSLSINQLADLLSTLIGRKSKKVYHPPRRYDVTHSLGSNKKMQDNDIMLSYSLEKGLSKTIEFYKNSIPS